ncbi:unnamed protein product [Schistosoma bovis]|nr:unnamed protein product [Schistosoma bovis]
MSSKVPILSAGGPLIFRQLFEKVSSTYTYLLADSHTKDAVIIDPVLETVERDKKLISQLNLKLGPIINTHLHADHVTGSGLLKRIPGSFSVLSHYDGVKVDKIIKHGDVIKFGNFELECRSTPGNTMTTVGEEKAFNPRLTKTKIEFVKIMNELNLPLPKQMERAIPLNLKCGINDE